MIIKKNKAEEEKKKGLDVDVVKLKGRSSYLIKR